MFGRLKRLPVLFSLKMQIKKNYQRQLESWQKLCTRVRPRFFDQVGHETMYASSGKKAFSY